MCSSLPWFAQQVILAMLLIVAFRQRGNKWAQLILIKYSSAQKWSQGDAKPNREVLCCLSSTNLLLGITASWLYGVISKSLFRVLTGERTSQDKNIESQSWKEPPRIIKSSSIENGQYRDSGHSLGIVNTILWTSWDNLSIGATTVRRRHTKERPAGSPLLPAQEHTIRKGKN